MASYAPASFHPWPSGICAISPGSRTHLIEERARLVNRLQAVLEDANIKLASVVTDVRGVSARAILEALVAGETDAQVLAELARGRLRTKRALLAQAVVGHMMAHHAFMIT